MCPICDKENRRRIPKLIEEYGWATLFEDTNKNEPPYCYTVGIFETLKLPEIVIFGLDKRRCHRTFHHIYYLLEKSREAFPHMMINYDILEDGFPVLFNDIDFSVAWDYLDYCNWYYEDKSIIYPAMQLIWPDEKKLFPWEENFNYNFIWQQPLICNF